MIVVWLVWYLKYLFFPLSISCPISWVYWTISRDLDRVTPGWIPSWPGSAVYTLQPLLTSSSKHLTKPQWNFFPLIQAVLNKSKSRFFRIKGHQLHLCFCISVFACFENIFWSACRAQVLTPLTFLPRSCLPRSFPERHNCTVTPKVLYLCFICLYLCILYSCICMFCTDISSLPCTCFVARWKTEKWSVYFCTS